MTDDTLNYYANRLEIKGSNEDIRKLLRHIYNGHEVAENDSEVPEICFMDVFDEDAEVKLADTHTTRSILACYDSDYFSLEFTTTYATHLKWFEQLGRHLGSENSSLFISLDYATEHDWKGERLEWCIEDGFIREAYDDEMIKERLCLWYD